MGYSCTAGVIAYTRCANVVVHDGVQQPKGVTTCIGHDILKIVAEPEHRFLQDM